MAANKKTLNRQMRELAEMGGNYAIIWQHNSSHKEYSLSTTLSWSVAFH